MQRVFDLNQSPRFLRHVTWDKSLNLSRPQPPPLKYAENKLPPEKSRGEAQMETMCEKALPHSIGLGLPRPSVI